MALDYSLASGLNKRQLHLMAFWLIMILTVTLPSSTLTPVYADEVSADITSGASSKTTDAFSLNPIEINDGDTVTWTNRDSTPHTVTSGIAGQPDGNFDSSPGFNPLLAPQDTFSHTFTEAGEYPYYCGLHPAMIGTVIVDGGQSSGVSITVETDRSFYQNGDVITVTGNLTVMDGEIDQPLLIQVIDPEGNRDRIDQLEAESGDYAYSFVAGALMNTEGIYDVVVSYKTTNSKTTFEFVLGPIPDDGLFCGKDVNDFDNVILGTASSDSINGTGADDLIRGFGGDDIIDGKGGDDCLIGNGGNDIIYGGPGEDAIYGGEGDDKLYGNNGDDILYGNSGDDLLSGGDGDDYLAGKSGNDDLFGNNGNDKMFGNEGDDYLRGGDGDDIMFGGDGDDELSGNTGQDRLSGQGGNDDIKGQRGDDRLSGGNGIDSLDGGRNSDKCYDSALGNTFLNCEDEFKTVSNQPITVNVSGDDVDNPPYESGDTVAVEGFLDRVVENEDVIIRFKEPSGSTEETVNFGEPSSNNNFDALFDIPTNADGGVWSVEVEYNDEVAYTYFLVEFNEDDVDVINLALDNSEGIYEAGDEVTISGQVDHDDPSEDTVNIKVFDPTDPDTEIQDEDVELDGADFEFSFDLDSDANPGRYAVTVSYDVDNQEGAILFEVGGESSNIGGDSESVGGLSAKLDQRVYAPGYEVEVSGTVDQVDNDDAKLRIIVEGPDGSQIPDYEIADVDIDLTSNFIYEFDLATDAGEGIYSVVVSYDIDEVELAFEIEG